MKLNALGLIAAILAFITIILPWYSDSVSNYSLLDFFNIASSVGFAGGTVLILATLVLIVIGGLIGLVGSFIAGKTGKSLLIVGGVLVILSPIVFAVRVMDVGLPLFGSYGGASVYVSFGFFLAVVAAILIFVSLRRHPMEAEVVPLAPVSPPPPPTQS